MKARARFESERSLWELKWLLDSLDWLKAKEGDDRIL